MLQFENLGLGAPRVTGRRLLLQQGGRYRLAVWLMNESDRTVRLFVGHSFGGAAVIAAAHALDSVRAVASVGAPYQPGPRRAQLRRARRTDPRRRGGAVPKTLSRQCSILMYDTSISVSPALHAGSDGAASQSAQERITRRCQGTSKGAPIDVTTG